MNTIDLIRENLRKSREIALARIEDMRDHCMVFPTPNGGCHTLWVLGHLAFIEGMVIRQIMLGAANPYRDWSELFDGDDISADISEYPLFDDVLATCRESRQSTLEIIDGLSEADLDRKSVAAPPGYDDVFGTWRRCLQYVADHWYMHRGQLADARRAAGVERMWV